MQAAKASGISYFFLSVFFALILVAIQVCVEPLTPWYSFALHIPGSLRPWAHNETVRTAATVDWSITDLDLTLYYPHFARHHSEIRTLNKANFFVDTPAPVLMLVQDVQKASGVLLTLCAIAACLSATAGLLTMCLSFSALCRKPLDLQSPSAVTLLPDGNAVALYESRYPWARRGAAIAMALAIGSSTMAAFGAVYYGVTLDIDGTVLLPSLLDRLRYFCFTHDPRQCDVAISVRWGAILFLAAAAAQLVIAACIYVVGEGKMPRQSVVWRSGDWRAIAMPFLPNVDS